MSDHDDNEALEESPQQQKLNNYIKELLAERNAIDGLKCPHLYKLIDEEIQKVQASGKVPFRDQKFVDVYRERPVKVSVKVSIPTREHPRYNFVGKLLGAKGNTLKQLQEETMCHISICGRGSIRDRQKEEELRQSLEPKYAHLHDELHIDVSTLGPPAEAHARIAYALAEIRKYLIPEYGEPGGRQDAIMEIMSKPNPSVLHEERSFQHRKPPGMLRGGGNRRSAPGTPPTSSARPTSRPAMSRLGPPKPKMVSILDRARVAMEGYDDGYDPREHHDDYEDYRGAGPAGGSRPSYSRGYDEYEQDYYRDGGNPYGPGGEDYGYKKRKTYMD